MPEPKTSTYSKTHELSANLLSFGLDGEAEELHKSASSTKTGRTAKTLIKEGPLNVTLVALQAGAALESHEVDGPITIQCLQGRLKLMTHAGAMELPEGGLVALAANVRHSAEAIGNCTLLLTITLGEAKG
jgi:quercetin dioxygenase-like cupin family protein